MAATRQDISAWFDSGVEQGATHMVVICDTYDHEDYPSYAFSEADARDKAQDHSNMKRPMECYKLSDDKADQMALHRCWRF